VLDCLLQYGLFLAEVTTVVIAIGVVIRFLFKAIRHAREYTAEHLEVKNLNRRATGARTSHPSLLTGMVFDETGERLTPTHAVKKGTRYRYYVSTSLLTGVGRTRSSGRRIPAGNLEGLVINRLRTFLTDPGAILDAVDGDSHNGSGRSQLIECGRQLAEDLGGLAPDTVKAMLMTLLCRVEIRSDRVEIAISRSRLTELLAGSPSPSSLSPSRSPIKWRASPSRLCAAGQPIARLRCNERRHR
jgi:hypothetical protein